MTERSSETNPPQRDAPASATPDVPADEAPLDLSDPQISQTFELLAAEIRSRLAQIEAREATLERGERCVLHSIRRLRRLLADGQSLSAEQLGSIEAELAQLSLALSEQLEQAPAVGMPPGGEPPPAGPEDETRDATQRADAIQRRLLENMQHVRQRQRELSERLAEARRRLARQRATQAERPAAEASAQGVQPEPGGPQVDTGSAVVVAEGSAPACDLQRPPRQPPGQPGPASALAPPPGRVPWLRSAVVAGVVAVASAAALWWFQRPAYVAEGELRIFTDAEPARTVVSGYTARMLATQPAAGCWPSDQAARRWTKLRQAGGVEIVPDFQRRAIRVRLRDQAQPGPTLAAGLQAWQRDFEQLPPAQRPDPRLVQWQRQRELIEHELQTLRARERELLGSLPTVASQPASAPAGATPELWQRLQRQLAEVQQQLVEARERLAELEHAPEPKGTVREGELQAALRRDAIYAEDARELLAAGRQLRSDLAVAMVLLNDPLTELRSGVQKLIDLVAEQQKLQPPPDVAAVLDAVATQADALFERISQFMLAWRARREQVERLEIPEQLDALLAQLDEADAELRQLVLALQRALDALRAAVAPLDAGDAGSTRAVIVAAMLRGELARLRQQIDAVAQAANKFTPRNNPPLDAGDRQVRNLRERLKGRRQRVHSTLAAQADARARQQHAERLEQARAAVARLEQQRDALTERLIAAAGRQDQREKTVAEVRQRTGRLLAVREQIRRAEQRLRQLDQQQRQPPPIRFQRSEVQVRQVAGQHRGRNTALGGVAVSVVVWLLCMLVFSGRGETPPVVQPQGHARSTD